MLCGLCIIALLLPVRLLAGGQKEAEEVTVAAGAACLAFPTENTKGFEIVPFYGLENCMIGVAAYLDLR
jgi:hypothetical protein